MQLVFKSSGDFACESHKLICTIGYRSIERGKESTL